jgi:hypothetical protein
MALVPIDESCSSTTRSKFETNKISLNSTKISKIIEKEY